MKRSALETLFARAAQGRVFLLMLPCGLLLGALLTLSGRLQKGEKGQNRPLGLLLDALCALAAAALMLLAACLAGEGLRLYAPLGLLVGVMLYRNGVQPLLDGLLVFFHRVHCGRR